MKINLITFNSPLNANTSILTSHGDILNVLLQHFSLNIVDSKDIKKISNQDFNLIFIGSGGVERMVIQVYELLPRPVIMIADGLCNSLAAAMEISTWFRSKGMKSEILHGSYELIVNRIKSLYNNFTALHSITGKRIGVIGTSSPWLISSNVDYLLAKRRLGVHYVEVSLDKIYKLYDKISDEEVGESCAAFVGKAVTCKEGSPEDILKAMRVYRAVKQLCDKEKLDAVTLSCFKIIERLGTTGCLALSILNDDGIPAGCEGDLQSVFTLLAMQAVTGKNGFMANPSMINSEENEVIFSHCTIGIKLTEKYIIRNHFESLLGISIQGILPPGDVTVVKCGGESLDEYFISAGTITENTDNSTMCRTQIKVKLDKSVDYFLKKSLGNHHIIIPGNYVETVHDFFQSNACKRIK